MTESTIPIQNIYFILSYAWKQLDEAGRVNVNVSDYNQYIDLFARVLSKGCSYLLKRGLDREYCLETESLSKIRGRIYFPLSFKGIMSGTPKLFCEYDELSEDILPNQIIKATIRKALRVKELNRKIYSELIDIYLRLNNISEINPTVGDFNKIRIHRNNLFYRFILNICYIINENISLDETSGQYEFIDFVKEEKKMAVIFEAFVRNFYRENLKAIGYEVKPEIIKWDVKDADEVSMGFLPDMKTDISIMMPGRKIIIDTKYYQECFKGRFDKKKLVSGHLYQLLAYCDNSDAESSSNIISEGMIIYPSVNNEEPLNYPDLKGRKVTVRFVNLNQDWNQISNDLLSFIY